MSKQWLCWSYTEDIKQSKLIMILIKAYKSILAMLLLIAFSQSSFAWSTKPPSSGYHPELAGQSTCSYQQGYNHYSMTRSALAIMPTAASSMDSQFGVKGQAVRIQA